MYVKTFRVHTGSTLQRIINNVLYSNFLELRAINNVSSSICHLKRVEHPNMSIELRNF